MVKLHENRGTIIPSLNNPHLYKYVSGHYPSSCLYFKTLRFEDQSLSPEIGTSCNDWAQLSRFYLKSETESTFRNGVF
jgi:hypothetical protein